MTNNKRLCRSREAMIGGVCGGIADHFGWDLTIVRPIYLVATCSTAFVRLPIYTLLWIAVLRQRYRNQQKNPLETQHNTSYPLLHELLDLVKRYEEFRSSAKQSMSSFLRFADQSLRQQVSIEESKTGSKGDVYLNAVVARNISFVYRYIRYLVHKAVKDTPLQTIDEYSYLITLMAKGEMTKTELNNYDVVEKTSGSEIIRRLLKSGLISQTRNLENRRSLLLSVAPEDRKVVKELLPHMQQGSDLFLRDLSWGQKIFPHTLHKQLYESNHPLFLTERDTGLEELFKKMPIKQATHPNKQTLVSSL